MHKILISISALAIATTTAYAQEKTLYVAGFGGSTETLLKEKYFPVWEAKTGAKISYVAGNSTDTLAKLRAQEGAQEIDVAFIDDGPMMQAIGFGYCDTIEEATFADLHEAARFTDNKAVGIGIIATGLTYNSEYFAQQGWEPPTSWRDLADPRYKGKVSVPPITNGYGLHALIMAAKINGGDVTNIEPGFEMFENEIDQNVLVYEPSSGKMSELFQNGEIVLSVWGSGRAKSLADTGFPAGFIYPKEGAVKLMSAICPVVASDVPDLAQDFIRFILSPEIQHDLATQNGWGPVNTTVELTEAEIGSLPFGEEIVGSMVEVDYGFVNEARGEWTQAWTRRIER